MNKGIEILTVKRARLTASIEERSEKIATLEKKVEILKDFPELQEELESVQKTLRYQKEFLEEDQVLVEVIEFYLSKHNVASAA